MSVRAVTAAQSCLQHDNFCPTMPCKSKLTKSLPSECAIMKGVYCPQISSTMLFVKNIISSRRTAARKVQVQVCSFCKNEKIILLWTNTNKYKHSLVRVCLSIWWLLWISNLHTNMPAENLQIDYSDCSLIRNVYFTNKLSGHLHDHIDEVWLCYKCLFF